jgi:hypothetical protein
LAEQWADETADRYLFAHLVGPDGKPGGWYHRWLEGYLARCRDGATTGA